jgi:uncharacterized protein YeaO (DUF488 family)
MLYSTSVNNVKNLTEDQKKILINVDRHYATSAYPSMIDLAPGEDIYKLYMNWKLTFEEYMDKFREQMKEEPTLTALRKLYVACTKQDIIIVGIENDFNKSPRKVIGEFIQSYGVMYNELGAPDSDFDYKCIVAQPENWYCKKCEKAHNRLYLNIYDNERYCPDCVPQDVKDMSIEVNQNGVRL